jgi:hypothetical protein
LLDQPTIQNLDVVILTTMRSLHMLSQQLKSSIYEDANRTEALREYKVQAQALIRFAGLLRLRLGADVYRQLSSLSEYPSIRRAKGRSELINRCLLLIKWESDEASRVDSTRVALYRGATSSDDTISSRAKIHRCETLSSGLAPRSNPCLPISVHIATGLEVLLLLAQM